MGERTTVDANGTLSLLAASKNPEVGACVVFYGTAYPGAAHAFFNEEGKTYNATAAADAWQKTLAFLRSELRAGG